MTYPAPEPQEGPERPYAPPPAPQYQQPPPQQWSPMQPDQRKAMLAQAVGRWVASGWRVESQMDFQAVLVGGKSANHVLHLLLTVFTCGLWAIVWLIVGLSSGEKRKVITVDDYGQILQH